jgi:hypothetical protein
MDDQHIAYEKLIAFAAGELEGAETRGVAIHIAICPSCAKTVSRFQTIASLMRTDDSHVPPPALIAKAQAIFSRRQAMARGARRRIGAIRFFPSVRRFSMAALIVLLVLSNLVVCTYVSNAAVASQDAIPGDSLYSLKLTIEAIELAASFSTEGKLDRHIAFAGYRLNETGMLITINRVAEIPGTLAAFENQVDQAAITFQILVKENYARAQAIGPRIESTLSQYSATLSNLRAIAPDSVKLDFGHAIALVATQESTIHQQYQAPAPTPSQTPAASLTAASQPSATRSARPSPTRAAAPLVSDTPGPVPNNTPAPVPSNTSAPVPTGTPVPVLTKTPMPTPSNTATPVPTWTSSPTPRDTKIPPGQTKTPNPPGKTNIPDSQKNQH